MSWHIDEVVEALRAANFEVQKMEDMELLTIRGYNDELRQKYSTGPHVLIKQMSWESMRIVRRKA